MSILGVVEIGEVAGHLAFVMKAMLLPLRLYKIAYLSALWMLSFCYQGGGDHAEYSC